VRNEQRRGSTGTRKIANGETWPESSDDWTARSERPKQRHERRLTSSESTLRKINLVLKHISSAVDAVIDVETTEDDISAAVDPKPVRIRSTKATRSTSAPRKLVAHEPRHLSNLHQSRELDCEVCKMRGTVMVSRRICEST
jgi:hypothetical protein